MVVGYYYRIDAASFGFEDFRLLVHAQEASKRVTARLFAFAREHPNVRKFVQCLSEWDYELDVSVPSAREVSCVIAALNERFRGEIRRIQLVSLFSEVNCSPFPDGWFE